MTWFKPKEELAPSGWLGLGSSFLELSLDETSPNGRLAHRKGFEKIIIEHKFTTMAFAMILASGPGWYISVWMSLNRPASHAQVERRPENELWFFEIASIVRERRGLNQQAPQAAERREFVWDDGSERVPLPFFSSFITPIDVLLHDQRSPTHPRLLGRSPALPWSPTNMREGIKGQLFNIDSWANCISRTVKGQLFNVNSW
ncbi:hypothetical protein FB451DRAFT_1182555 [Mycena latifolia]|nr:hypothetical protein FB451DRAFT_1182555 [Mycena latifolia]